MIGEIYIINCGEDAAKKYIPDNTEMPYFNFVKFSKNICACGIDFNFVA